MNGRLLIVEDDAALNAMLGVEFEEMGYSVSSATSVDQALTSVASRPPDVALVDQYLPDGNGTELLGRMLQIEPDLAVIMITGMRDLELAIKAIQAGALDFVHKPVQMEELSHSIARAFEQRRLARMVAGLDRDRQRPATLGDMIGQSRAMLEVSKEIALVATSDARVLITGESGTGKELVARAIHSHSGRKGPFLGVNCAAIVDTLLESDLFGHEKGAFTGAIARKIGKFELATEGTLFLDEVGELAPSLQAKLLRVLQEGVFERVGGSQQFGTGARVVAATNRTLSQEVAEGRFREDLLYRLNVIHIGMPPLRERREDVPLLVSGLLERLSRTLHRPILQVTEAAMSLLTSYHWPGNVREMENVLTQAMIRARGNVITPDLLGLGSAQVCPRSGGPMALTHADGRPFTLDEVEARHIQLVLRYSGGHKGRTCEILGISRPALDRKISKYGLDVPQKGIATGH